MPRDKQATARAERSDAHAIPERFRQAVAEYIALVKGRPPYFFGECSEWHPGYSCPAFTFKRIPDGIPTALKVYLPIHFIPMIIFRRKELLKNPQKHLLHAAGSTGRSVLFLVMFLTHFMATLCVHRRITRRDTWVGPFLGGITAGLSLQYEKQSRRVELMLYCVPRFLEACWKFLAKRNLVKSVPYGEIVLFALSFGALMTLYQHQPKAIKPTYRGLLAKLIGTN